MKMETSLKQCSVLITKLDSSVKKRGKIRKAPYEVRKRYSLRNQKGAPNEAKKEESPPKAPVITYGRKKKQASKLVKKPIKSAQKKRELEPADSDSLSLRPVCVILEDILGHLPAYEKKKYTDVEDVEDEDEDHDSLNDPDLLKELKSLSCETPEEFVASSEEVKRNSSTEFPVSKDPPSPSHPEMISPTSIVTLLEERLKLYTDAIAAAKELNDSSKVCRYNRVEKVLKELIKSAKAGKNITERDIPPVVSIPKAKTKPISKQVAFHNETQQSSLSMEASALSAASGEPANQELDAAPPACESILRDLRKRLEKFKSIVHVYENAIFNYQAGHYVNFEELPMPAGFDPIPIPEVHEKSKRGDSSLISMESKKVPSASSNKPAPNVPSRADPEIPVETAAPEVPPTTAEHQKSKVKKKKKIVSQGKSWRMILKINENTKDIFEKSTSNDSTGPDECCATSSTVSSTIPFQDNSGQHDESCNESKQLDESLLNFSGFRCVTEVMQEEPDLEELSSLFNSLNFNFSSKI